MRGVPTTEPRVPVLLPALRAMPPYRERLGALAILLLPPALVLALALEPAWNIPFENHWFHFQIVTFVSFVAFVLGVTMLVLLKTVQDVRALLIPLALGALSGIFMLHGLATPDVLQIAHAEHTIPISLFPR